MAISKEIKDKLGVYGIDGININNYQVVLDNFELNLALINLDGHDYLVFKNEDNSLFPVQTLPYGIVLGFAFCEQDDTQENSELRMIEAAEELGESNSFFYFSKEILEQTIKSLDRILLEESLDFTPSEFDYYFKIFDQYGIVLEADFIGENPILVFKNKIGAHQGISGIDGDKEYLGFLFPFEDEEDYKFTARKKYVEKKYRGLLFNENICFLKYSKENWKHFVNCLPQEEQKTNNKILTKEEEGDLTLLKQQVLDYLNGVFSGSQYRAVSADSQVTEQDNHRVVSTERFPKVDILIISSTDDLSVKPAYLDLYGWKAKKELPFDELIPYGNICGLVVVNNEEDLVGRKSIRKSASAELRHYYPTEPNGKVMTVDRNLLKRWEEIKTPEVIDEVKQMTVSSLERRKAAAYGFGKEFIKRNGAPEVSVYFYEPFKSHIGGTQITMVAKYDENYSRALMLDSGYIFDVNPAWGGIGSGPSYSDGIMPFLRSGMFPQTRRLYRPDLLNISLRPVSVDHVIKLSNGSDLGKKFSNHDEFLVLELYHYHGEEEFMAMLQQSMPKYLENIRRRGKVPGLLRYLARRDKELYTQKTFYDGLLLTHAHQDHAIGSSFMREEIVRGWSPITRALLLADHKLANAWYVQDTAARKRRDLPKVGAAYPVTEYPFINFIDGQRIEVAPGIFVTGYDVYHSIPGSMGFKVEVEHNGKVVSSVGYGGDYRDSGFFKKLGETDPVDLLIIEGTNPPGTQKESITVNEDQVRKNMAEVFNEARDAHKLLIVDLVKNNFERVLSIIEEGVARGRTIVISPKIAWRCRSIELLQTQMPEHLKLKLPDFNDPRIKLWKKPMSRYLPIVREMFEKHGYVDQDGLSEVPEQYILVRDGNEQPEKLEGIQADAIWLLSIYGTYDHGAGQTRRHLYKHARQAGWDVRSQGFHATGHGPLLKSDHPDSEGSILDELGNARADNYAILHTQKRKKVSSAMKTYSNLKNATIHDNFEHPMHKIFLNKK